MTQDLAEVAKEPENGLKSCFFHGKESGPYGTKYQALKDIDRQILSPDFQHQSLAERLITAELATRGFTDLIIVGSSMGGLVAALLYQQCPERIKGLLMLAPALHWEEAKTIQSLPENTVLIHGRQDEVVLYSHSEQLAHKRNFRLISVEDDHRLSQTLQIITAEFKSLLSLQA